MLEIKNRILGYETIAVSASTFLVFFTSARIRRWNLIFKTMYRCFANKLRKKTRDLCVARLFGAKEKVN